MNLDKSKVYILACSYGPDSMALFDMLLQESYSFVVCHVNYHQRIESDYEEKSLEAVCQKYGIPIYVYDTEDLVVEGNFQAWARKARYVFFSKIYHKIKADALLVAQHEDDLLETFIMQKGQNKIVSHYGIAEETQLFGMRVLRPLLDYSKKSLLDYCQNNKVPYSIDSSNLSDDYTRNKIRHHDENLFDEVKRKTLLDEVIAKNEGLARIREQVRKLIQFDYIMIDELLKVDEQTFIMTLHDLIKDKMAFYEFSAKKAKEIKKVCLSRRPNIKMLLHPPFYLVKEYQKIRILRECETEGYCYRLEKPDTLETPYFILYFNQDTSNRNVFDYDYPLTIRTYESGDIIKVGIDKYKKVRRLFIDWKMPASIRKTWPIFVNKDGEIVYIPRYFGDFVFTMPTNLIIK